MEKIIIELIRTVLIEVNGHDPKELTDEFILDDMQDSELWYKFKKILQKHKAG